MVLLVGSRLLCLASGAVSAREGRLVPGFTFPLLAVGERPGTVGVYTDEDQLLTSTARAIEQGYYSGMRLVDREGNLRRVKRAAIAKGEGSGMWRFLFGKPVRVTLELEPSLSKADLDTIKQDILVRLEEIAEAWEEAQEYDHIRSRVLSAQS
jgi:hypothetical protein